MEHELRHIEDHLNTPRPRTGPIGPSPQLQRLRRRKDSVSSLRDLGTGTIPVQCLVALRGTEGVFAHPFGEEGEPANRKQDNTRPVPARNHRPSATLPF